MKKVYSLKQISRKAICCNGSISDRHQHSWRFLIINDNGAMISNTKRKEREETFLCFTAMFLKTAEMDLM